jgi:cytochrome P450 RapN
MCGPVRPRPTWQAREIDVPGYPFAPAEGLTIDPVYRDLQREGPVKVQLPFGEPCWLATRYEDCRTVYGDRRFGRRIGLDHDAPGMWPSEHVKDPDLLVNMDPPEHSRLRRLTSGAFSPAAVERLAGRIQELVDRLFENMAQAGPGCDFVERFSSRLPPQVMAGLLGVPDSDGLHFAALVDQLVGVGLAEETRAEAHGELRNFILGLVAERRNVKRDDLLGALVEARDDDDRLSEEELFNLGLSLWLGGVDTTRNELGSMVYTLMIHPDRWEELRNEPSLLPDALEELWRWIPSHKYGVLFARWASEDVWLSGDTLIPAGEPVMPEHTVANRDESAFPHGWTLDFRRVDPRPHLTFAHGAHHCMGSHLARLEVRTSMAALIERFPGLQLDVAPEDVEWSSTSMLRSAVSLPLTW